MFLLDGRNRLDGMEMVGIEILQKVGDKWTLKVPARYLSWEPNPPLNDGGVSPYSFALSANLHRRHLQLTKEEQSDLILRAVKLEEAELLTMRRSGSMRISGGSQGGSTKDPLKEKFIEETAKQGISKATAQRSWDKDRGPAFERTAPKLNINNIATEREAKNTLSYLEGRFRNLPHSAIKEIITSVVDRFGGDERSFYRERLDEGFYHNPGSDPLAEFNVKKFIHEMLECASENEMFQIKRAIENFLSEKKIKQKGTEAEWKK